MRKMEILRQYPQIHEIFHRLKEKEEAVYLDSSTRNELGQFSIIGCRPYKKFMEKDGVFTINGEPCEDSFFTYVKQYLNDHKEENDTKYPLLSGGVGYFSYDFGREMMGVESSHKKTVDIPDCILYFYDFFLIEDHEKEELAIIANGYTQTSEEAIEYLKKVILEEGKPDDSPAQIKSRVYTDFTQQAYMNAVDHMIQYIVDGDIYVVNMTQQLQVESDCDPYDMFCRLRKSSPSPFGGYFDYGDFQIVCASPERFMKMKNGKITTRPIKGTRKRGKTIEEDMLLKADLANSEKEKSELLMIVDLERNDLNKVCIPGSVIVTELFQVETYATVFHLVSNVEGMIRPECNAMDLIEATFPGGSITGTPKLRAMELIDQEERARRNLYTGSIGYLSLNGDCDFNIVIRTGIHKDGVYHLGVGGGITCESDLEFEFEETWQKAAALLKTLQVKTDGEKYEYTVR